MKKVKHFRWKVCFQQWTYFKYKSKNSVLCCLCLFGFVLYLFSLCSNELCRIVQRTVWLDFVTKFAETTFLRKKSVYYYMCETCFFSCHNLQRILHVLGACQDINIHTTRREVPGDGWEFRAVSLSSRFRLLQKWLSNLWDCICCE